jgi:hypothetical protein
VQGPNFRLGDNSVIPITLSTISDANRPKAGADAGKPKSVIGVTATGTFRVYAFFERMEACVMTTANNTDRELTEKELEDVAGGTPSIPIPPPRPLGLRHVD